ncbi:MAG: PfkB family carbohydrate kinase, partial [Candidatus Humimicrobiaceae bacterium]
CKWDEVSLGEVMLRLDPGFSRIKTARTFQVWEGGGDSFASGLIYGFLSGKDPDKIVEYGSAHGALAMATPGDTSMASLKEVEKIVGGDGARIDR